MRKEYSRNLKLFLVLAALLAGVVGANFAFANGHNQHISQAHIERLRCRYVAWDNQYG